MLNPTIVFHEAPDEKGEIMQYVFCAKEDTATAFGDFRGTEGEPENLVSFFRCTAEELKLEFHLCPEYFNGALPDYSYDQHMLDFINKIHAAMKAAGNEAYIPKKLTPSTPVEECHWCETETSSREFVQALTGRVFCSSACWHQHLKSEGF